MYILHGFTKFSSNISLFGPIMLVLFMYFFSEFGNRNKPDFTEQMLIKLSEDDENDKPD